MGTPGQAFYSLSELARMSGVDRRRIETLLKSNGVTFRRTGGPRGRIAANRVVMVSELHRAMPDLVDSIRFVQDDE